MEGRASPDWELRAARARQRAYRDLARLHPEEFQRLRKRHMAVEKRRRTLARKQVA